MKTVAAKATGTTAVTQVTGITATDIRDIFLDNSAVRASGIVAEILESIDTSTPFFLPGIEKNYVSTSTCADALPAFSPTQIIFIAPSSCQTEVEILKFLAKKKGE